MTYDREAWLRGENGTTFDGISGFTKERGDTMSTHTPERLRCEVCDMPTLGDTLCNLHYEEQEAMSTHTPGPWACKSPMYKGLSAGIVRDAFNDPIADCRYSEVPIRDKKTPEQISANAHLIAAAPAMLEVLKNAIHDGRLQTFEDRERFRTAAREAIRLAEGRG